MENTTFQTIDGKIILRLRDRICENPEELLSSEQFQRVLKQFIASLERKNSTLLSLFNDVKVQEDEISRLNETLIYLSAKRRGPGRVKYRVPRSAAHFHSRQ